MVDWAGLAIFSIFIVALSAFVVDNFRQRLANKKALATITQILADKEMILERLHAIQDEKNITQTEEFVKFLVTSRDMAFDYIETVHSSMELFTIDVEPHLKNNPELLTIVNQLYDRVMPDNPNT